MFPGGKHGLEDYSVLLALKNKLQCGEVYISTKKEYVKYRVTKIKDLIDKIIPLLKEGHLYTVKQEYLVSSFEVWNILYTEGIQSDKNLQRVVDLVYNINLDGKNRKITKETYLQRFIILLNSFIVSPFQCSCNIVVMQFIT